MNYHIQIDAMDITQNTLNLTLSGYIIDPTISLAARSRPKLVLFFSNGKEDRRMPFVFDEVSYIEDRCIFGGTYGYRLDLIYWATRGQGLPNRLAFHLNYGNDCVEDAVFTVGEQLTVDPHYTYTLHEDAMVFFPIPKKESKLWRVMRPVLSGIFYVILYLIALCFLPLFFLEAVLSFTGITHLDPGVRTTVPIRQIIGHMNRRVSRFSYSHINLLALYKALIICLYKIFSIFPVQNDRVSFISMRRNDLSGNFAFVYDQMKNRTDLNIRFILCYSDTVLMPPITLIKFCYACARSKVVVLDEFTPQIHYLNLRKPTRLIQLWHACGAFKTFGFTRLGKPAGSPQMTRNHRSYDYVTVSSTYCKKCHSEGFGIPDSHIVPTGIARTDVFFDPAYQQRVREDFYTRYPQLVNKKIMLFAPTFRGSVKETAFYPVEKFDLKKVYEAIGDEYAILVKHHPFVPQKQPIPQEYSDFILDLSENSELNDLLFVTDLIVTDYSSLIFEASLLKIPMLFYVYDLQEYTKDRDFYFDLRLNSPGKLVYSLDELLTAVKNQDFEPDRMEDFARMFFDHFDGQSTKRVVDLIEHARQE